MLRLVLVLYVVVVIINGVSLDDGYPINPSSQPTIQPSTSQPSIIPSSSPSSSPSSFPSSFPSSSPLSSPSSPPSSSPSSSPSSHPTINPPTSSPTPPQNELGTSWYYLTIAHCTFYGTTSALKAYPTSSDQILEAADISFKFVIQDELIDNERDDITIYIEAYNKNRLLNDITTDYDDDDNNKDLKPISTIVVHAWSSKRSTATKLVSVFHRLNKRPLLLVQPMRINNVHAVTTISITDISLTIDTIGPKVTEEKFSPSRILYVIVGTVVIFLLAAMIFSKVTQHQLQLKSAIVFLIQLAIDAINEVVNIFSQLYDHVNGSTNHYYHHHNRQQQQKNTTRWQELKDDDNDSERSVKFTINDDDDDDDDDAVNDTNTNPIINNASIEMSSNNTTTESDNTNSP